MQAQYKRDYEKSNMVFRQEFLSGNALFQQQMLLENTIDGLLPCTLHSFNGETELFYDITGKQTISCLYEKRLLKAADLTYILKGVYDALCSMQAFLLQEEFLILDPEYMYVEPINNNVLLCFYPFEEHPFMEQVIGFAEYLLEHTDHEDQEAVVLVYQFYRMIRQKGTSFAGVMAQLFPEKPALIEHEEQEECKQTIMEDEIFLQEDEPEEMIEQKRYTIPYVLAGICMAGAAGYGIYCYMQGKGVLAAISLFLIGFIGLWLVLIFSRISKAKQQTMQSPIEVVELDEPVEEIEQTDALEDDKTILLSENVYEEKRRLVCQDRKKTVIPLQSFPFVIGTKAEHVDFPVTDRSVSHVHARFLLDEETKIVSVQDLNSTNGTFYNGIRLDAGEMQEIFAGDEIRMGKRVFVYE